MVSKIRVFDYTLLSELIKNSKISDRKLARKLGVSQPTITRRRTFLERKNLLDYQAMPNFSELGFEIIAITFLAVKSELRFPKDTSTLQRSILLEHAEESDRFYSENPNVFFAATGRGLEKNSVLISVHENYSSMVEFLRDIELKFGKVFNNMETFIISTKSDRMRRLFNFKHFADYLKKIKTKRSS